MLAQKSFVKSLLKQMLSKQEFFRLSHTDFAAARQLNTTEDGDFKKLEFKLIKYKRVQKIRSQKL